MSPPIEHLITRLSSFFLDRILCDRHVSFHAKQILRRRTTDHPPMIGRHKLFCHQNRCIARRREEVAFVDDEALEV